MSASPDVVTLYEAARRTRLPLEVIRAATRLQPGEPGYLSSFQASFGGEPLPATTTWALERWLAHDGPRWAGRQVSPRDKLHRRNPAAKRPKRTGKPKGKS